MSNTLEKFFLGLSDNTRERARKMGKICANAEISYAHVKCTMAKTRSLGIDSATRLQAECAKQGGKIDLKDLLIQSKDRK